MNKYFAEITGTFALVFFGTGAIIVDQQMEGIIGHLGIAVAFGLIVLAMIYTFGDISGAHLNPAVTLGFAAAGLFGKKNIPMYLLSQFAGAILASAVLKFLFPENQTLGSTNPSGGMLQSFIIEIIASFFLMLVIIRVSHGSKEVGILAGIAIGSTILIEALVAGPVSALL